MLSGLWAEVTISGFFFVASLFFLALKLLNIQDLTLFAALKDYLTFISIGVLGMSYIFGILAHRAATIVFVQGGRLIHRGNHGSQQSPGAEMVQVWQYGSERLHQELDYQYNFLSLFTSMTVAAPTLGLCAAIWLADTAANRLAIPALVLGILLGCGFFVAELFQLGNYRALRLAAREEAEKVAKASKN